jgi:acetyl-CoA carboxylase biotin carboxyl carrier protein
MPDWNEDVIRQALTVARSHGFAEVELEAGGIAFQATLSPVPATKKTVLPTAVIEFEPETAPSVKEITAPLVGYFQPAKEPMVVGRRIESGDIVGVISALGLANDVEANTSGEVTRVLVVAGQSVEFGQVLAEVRLEP